MSLSHDTDAKVTTADIELARKLVAQFQDDDFDCERISFKLACHRHTLIAERDAMRGAIRTIMARCEALEDEACDGLTDASTEHAQGWWRGQKSTAKSIRRELHDLTLRALAATSEGSAS